MHIASIGIDLDNSFHLGALEERNKVLRSQEVLTGTATGLYREPARIADRACAGAHFLLERRLTFAARPIYLRKNLPTVIEDAEQNLSSRLRWMLDRAVAGVEANGDRHSGDHRRDRAY